MGQHSKDATVIILAFGNSKLHQHMPHVRLNCALAQVEAPGDARVGESLRHLFEHLAFALRELRERIVFATRSNQTSDHLGIERGTPVGNAFCRVEEGANLEHAVFEQVAKAAEGDELYGMHRLDVLREDEHAQVGIGLLGLPRRTRALVGERRRHTDVQDDEVRAVLGDSERQRIRISEGGRDLVSCILEEPAEPLAQQHLILRDHNPHGNSAVSLVPAPWLLSMRSVPP